MKRPTLKVCTIATAVILCLGVLVARSFSDVEPPPKEEADQPLAHLIANKLRNGDLQCPKDDGLTYESCLLFQGALGIWQRTGLVDECPDLYDSSRASQKSSVDSRPLSPEDVLHAINSPCFGYLYAIRVANAVPVLVNVTVKTFKLATAKNYLEPGSAPDLCISGRFGSCGNQAATALAFFEKAGFKARSVQFYYENKGVTYSHIIPEVFIQNKYRPIDTTYGSYWISSTPGRPFELATLDEILRKTGVRRFDNQALLPYSFAFVIKPGDPFDYLTQKSNILRGGVGQIGLSFRMSNGKTNFTDLPNYVGDNIKDGMCEGVVYRFKEAKGVYSIKIKANALASDQNEKSFVCVDKNCIKLTSDILVYEFMAANPLLLYVKSNQDVAYVVMDSMEWKRL